MSDELQKQAFIAAVIELRSASTRSYLGIVHSFSRGWFGAMSETDVSVMFAISSLTHESVNRSIGVLYFDYAVEKLRPIWPDFEPLASQEIKDKVNALLAEKSAAC